jgi:hypothetical protein
MLPVQLTDGKEEREGAGMERTYHYKKAWASCENAEEAVRTLMRP